MKVLMLTDRSGATWEQREGEIYDLPKPEAMSLVKAGQAAFVETEFAVNDKSETASLRISKPSNRKGRIDALP